MIRKENSKFRIGNKTVFSSKGYFIEEAERMVKGRPFIPSYVLKN